jgi:hypothetical protein
MNCFDHSVFVYMSLETTNKHRFCISHRFNVPTVDELVGKVKASLEVTYVSLQLLTIGFQALAWGLAGNLAENLAGN